VKLQEAIEAIDRATVDEERMANPDAAHTPVLDLPAYSGWRIGAAEQ
jgi:hypothetical protein